MAQFNGPTLIDAPMPPQRPVGLFDVGLGPMPFPTQNLGGGVIYVPDTCADDVYLVDMSCPPVTGTKSFTDIETPVSGAPFAVYTSYTCGSIGFSFEEARQRVLTRMALREQRAVEKRVWSGSSGAGGTITGLFRGATNLGAVDCIAKGVQVLEQALADNGVVGGIIHARAGMGVRLQAGGLLALGPGRVSKTITGTPYVFGQGYDGSGPTGQAATSTGEWMYASGRVLVWQDPETMVPDPRQTLNRSTNQMYVLAERVYAVAVECGVWAVQVGTGCNAGAP